MSRGAQDLNGADGSIALLARPPHFARIAIGGLLVLQIHRAYLECFLRRSMPRAVSEQTGLVPFVAVRVESHTSRLFVAKVAETAQVYGDVCMWLHRGIDVAERTAETDIEAREAPVVMGVGVGSDSPLCPETNRGRDRDSASVRSVNPGGHGVTLHRTRRRWNRNTRRPLSCHRSCTAIMQPRGPRPWPAGPPMRTSILGVKSPETHPHRNCPTPDCAMRIQHRPEPRALPS